MTDQLEAQIRDALAHCAEVIPPRSERFLGADYRPRSSRLRMTTTLGPLVAVAGVGVTVAVIGLGNGASRAFAVWSASPTSPASGQTAAAEAVCRADMPSSSQIQKANSEAGGPKASEPGPSVSPNGLPAALVDTRGAYTFVLLGASGERAACLIGPWPTSKPLFSSTSYGASPSSSPASDQIGDLSFGFGRLTDEEGLLSVTGRVGEGVSGVTLILHDGTRVTTRIAQGWFLAWWPGTDQALSAEVQGSAGSSMIDLNDPLSKSASFRFGVVPPAVAARRLAISSH
jgi:hypothetical protein